MLARRIFVTVFALFTVSALTACPHDIAKSVAESESLGNEYNDRVSTTRQAAEELRTQYNIDVYGFSFNSASTYNWSQWTPEVRKTIRTKLTNHLINLGRMLELSNHKSVRDRTNDFERAKIQNNQRITKEYLDSAKRFDGIPR